MFDPGTWTCHVCKRERPDDKIGVHSHDVQLPKLDVPIRQNVRYCLDDPECVARAPHVNFIGSGRVT